MKTYKVFEKGGQKVAVKQGWSWPAFICSWIWAFTKKLIIAGIIGLVCSVAMIPFGVVPYLVIGGVIFGWLGNKWWEAQLVKSGFTAVGTVQANSPAEAASSKL